jgi:hypothetical protein
MQAAIAEPMDEPGEPRSGVFLSAVESRRRQVLSALAQMPERDRAAEFIFDLLSHVALDAEAVLDAALFDAFARRYRLDDDALGASGGPLRLPASLGGDVPLRDRLIRGAFAGPALDGLNALFTLGYALKLGALDVVERRTFTLKVVAMLPGAERIGPFVLTDFLDVVCEEDDALRFWQIYVDRVAAEIAKRGGAPEISTREPWLLSRLLALHSEGPMAPRGAWLALTRHVNRILQAHRHRWRFIRHLAEGCHEPRMLCYLCTSPAMVEDPEVIPVFLTRGNSRLVSCALLALSVYRDARAAVDVALAQLRERPFAEVASRVVEIYGQLHLFPMLEHGSALHALKEGLVALVAVRLEEAPLDLLPNAVSKDSRSLRQNLLLVDVEPALRDTNPAFAQQYLERVVGTWLQTFTPSGVEHPLNDQIWRNAVCRALVRLVEADLEAVAERIEAFGGRLPETAERWAEGDALMSQHLSARFVALFGNVWLNVCRALQSDPQTRDLAGACYATLVRLFARLEPFAQGSGGFGAIEYVLPGLFPDLVGADAPSPRRVLEAADLVGQVEGALHAGAGSADGESTPAAEPPRSRWFRDEDGEPDTDESANRPDRSSRRAAPREPEPTEHHRDPRALPLLKRRPTRDHPLEAEAFVSRRPTGRWAALLRAYTGYEVLADLGERALRLLGVQRRGRIALTESEVVVTSAATLGRAGLAGSAMTWRLDELTGVRVEAGFRVFPLVLGGLGLAAGALFGGHLLFVGLRTDDLRAILWAVGLVLGGVLADASLSRLARENARTFRLELHGRDARQSLRLVIDARAGAELLDAFMAHDAARRELEALRDWTDRPRF